MPFAFLNPAVGVIAYYISKETGEEIGSLVPNVDEPQELFE